MFSGNLNLKKNVCAFLYIYIYIFVLSNDYSWLNHIQNKSFCLHNICVCTVYIYYVYINTHTYNIYFENIDIIENNVFIRIYLFSYNVYDI